MTSDQRAKLLAEHLEGILHDLCLHVLPDILGYTDIDPDNDLTTRYGMDVVDGYDIENSCENLWYCTLSLNLGFEGCDITTPRNLAKAIQAAQQARP